MDYCSLCRQSVGEFPVYVKHKDIYKPACCGDHAEKLHSLFQYVMTVMADEDSAPVISIYRPPERDAF